MEKIITYEDIQKANETIITTDIKGKDYAEVNQRIKAFRMVYPQGSLLTEMLSNENGVCIFKASVYTDDGKLLATGTAYEKEGSTFINKTSYIENCETSALGRALGIAGFGIDTSIASADEVQNAIANQEVTQEEADNYTLTFGKHKGKKLNELPKDYIEWMLGNSKDERMIKMIELATGTTMPSEEEQKEILNKMMELHNLLEQTKTDRETFYKYYKVTSDGEMTLGQLNDAIEKLKEKANES